MAGSGGRAAVLGAGLQGVGAALALAHLGWEVTLVDRTPEPLQGASARGEGKLHLGYVYANDPGRATARLLVEAALCFSAVIDSWTPAPLPWPRLRSRPFHYAVLPGSMLAPGALAEHYAWVDEQVAAHLAEGGRYAGGDVVAPARRLSAPNDVGLREVAAAFATGEVAIEPRRLRPHLLDAVRSCDVGFVPGIHLDRLERTPAGWEVHGTSEGGEPWALTTDVVVNCLWDGRLALDASAGVRPPLPWIHRLKHGVHGRLPADRVPPPSTTLVLGPYGDVVQHASGRVYASWYPECHTATSQQVAPPRSWPSAGPVGPPDDEQRDLARRTLAALARHVPAIEPLDVEQVAAGVIVAWGETDIDRRDSELHHRHQIGVHDHGDGHLSIDTGKLTTAPLFARRLAQRLGPPS